MEVLNRIRSTVSSFSTVLLGNPVTREYEVIEHIASCGPGLLWKVYKGIKKSTKEEAAVFVLEKKLLDRYPKYERDSIVEIMKRGVSNLTRLRHPSILTVQHPLEESRESLAFATEPVFSSLANILGREENTPVSSNKTLKNFELYDVEIKYGLLQIVEGLAFLHNDVKMLHRNVNPESVMVNKNGAWKLAGFDFCIQNDSSQDQLPFSEIDYDRPPPSLPHLNYLAPEYVLAMTCSSSSDMFSYGALIYSVYNKGKSFMNNFGSFSSLKQNYKQLKNIPSTTFNCLPVEFREHVKLLLNFTPEIRPDAFQTSKLQMFEDVGVKTLQYLDSLYQWDNLQKSHFYKGLPQIISKMPKRVTLFRVLPCLVKEYYNPEMVPFVLPSVLLIAADTTKEEFQENILHDMIPLFRLQEPVQIMLIFMQKMELLLKKCSPAAINNHVLPMIYRALEADAQQIQELCLSIIPRFAVLIEYSAMKNALIPRIKKLCISTSYLSVRVNCLVCLGKILEHLDKWLVLDEILPFLPQIPSKEPAVLMGILGILKLTMSHKKLGITKEIMASKTIPFLMPLSIENGLTLNQFNAIMSVVKEMVSRVEAEHKTKLEQLNSIRQEQNSALGLSSISSGPVLFEAFTSTDKQNSNDVFKDLGLSSFGASEGPINSVSSEKNNSSFMPNNAISDGREQSLSLSLEEKKKLAWEQEQQRQFVSQRNALLMPSNKPTTPIISSPVKPPNAMFNQSSLTSFCTPQSNSLASPMVSPVMVGAMSPPAQSPLQFQCLRNPTGWPQQNQPALSAKKPWPAAPSQSMDLSSLDNLLPAMNKSSRTLNQMSIDSPFQSLNLANQMPWVQGSAGPNLSSSAAISPVQSGPQSLPVFTQPSGNPKSELNDLLG